MQSAEERNFLWKGNIYFLPTKILYTTYHSRDRPVSSSKDSSVSLRGNPAPISLWQDSTRTQKVLYRMLSYTPTRIQAELKNKIPNYGGRLLNRNPEIYMLGMNLNGWYCDNCSFWELAGAIWDVELMGAWVLCSVWEVQGALAFLLNYIRKTKNFSNLVRILRFSVRLLDFQRN